MRIVDIRGLEHGVGAAKRAYTGIFPMIVSAPMAIYCSGLIESSKDMDACMKLVDLNEGIQMSTEWF